MLALLLDSILTAPLDPRVREQIVSETRGIPLAMLELLRDLTPAELAGGFGLAGGVPVSGSVEETFRRRIDALPSDSRRLLQLAAADPVGDPLLVWRAAERLGISTDAATASSPGRPTRVRRTRALSPSAGAFGGLLVGVASGEAGSAPRPGGSDRPRDRPRPPRLAPSPRCPRPRRGRRRGARPLRRSGAGARRLSCGCRLSRALGPADTRTRPPCGTPSCGCQSEAGCRGVRSSAGASRHTRDCAARLLLDGRGGALARADRLGATARQRRGPSCCSAPPDASRHSTPPWLAKRTWRRSWRRCGRVISIAPAACWLRRRLRVLPRQVPSRRAQWTSYSTRSRSA